MLGARWPPPPAAVQPSSHAAAITAATAIPWKKLSMNSESDKGRSSVVDRTTVPVVGVVIVRNEDSGRRGIASLSAVVRRADR